MQTAKVNVGARKTDLVRARARGAGAPGLRQGPLVKPGAAASAVLAAARPRLALADISRWKAFVDQYAGDQLITLASLLSLLGLWYLSAWLLPSSVMPSPHAVVEILWQQVQGDTIWSDVVITLGRIAAAFSVAMAVSLVLGFAMGVSHAAERFFDVWVVCLLTLPSLVLILTIYMIVGLNDRAAILGAAVPVIPILTINIWQGVKGVDHKLIDMAKACHASKARIMRSVIAPQIAPVIVASARFGLGLAWKMVLFVELLGRSDGIGYRIEFYYQMFNMGAVLAHALLFLVIMLFLEVVLLGMLERRLFRWRPAQRRL
ncbi:MAG TPA: ABC transporter permease [Xanthobacteraceae bacterium]|nr:ABC transporter permease [Xanthobacteraceae bacterium]